MFMRATDPQGSTGRSEALLILKEFRRSNLLGNHLIPSPSVRSTYVYDFIAICKPLITSELLMSY
jgi:hypothetical protein